MTTDVLDPRTDAEPPYWAELRRRAGPRTAFARTVAWPRERTERPLRVLPRMRTVLTPGSQMLSDSPGTTELVSTTMARAYSRSRW